MHSHAGAWERENLKFILFAMLMYTFPSSRDCAKTQSRDDGNELSSIHMSFSHLFYKKYLFYIYFILDMISFSIKYYMMKGQTYCEVGMESHGSLADGRVTKHK